MAINERRRETPSASTCFAASRTVRGPATMSATDRLSEVRVLAERLFAEHRLDGWRFEYDNARRRAGACHFTRRAISLSKAYVQAVSEAEIRDTLLHEIAHALLGPKEGHGPRWKELVQSLGGTAQRCHDLTFVQPRYIVRCIRGCFAATAERRNFNAVCRRCRTPVEYLRYSPERMQQYQ